MADDEWTALRDPQAWRPRGRDVPLAPSDEADAADDRHVRDAAERCACVVAGFFRVIPTELFKPTRGTAAEAFARQVWMAGLVEELGYSSGVVGRAIGRDKATVDHACKIISALRGDMDALDLADILGSDGVQDYLGGLDQVELFVEHAETLLDRMFAAFHLVGVLGARYCAEREQRERAAYEQRSTRSAT